MQERVGLGNEARAIHFHFAAFGAALNCRPPDPAMRNRVVTGGISEAVLWTDRPRTGTRPLLQSGPRSLFCKSQNEEAEATRCSIQNNAENSAPRGDRISLSSMRWVMIL